MSDVIQATTEKEFEYGRLLFEGYARLIGIDLCFQNFEKELENIRQIYSPPDGCLLLALDGNQYVGWVGLRKLNDKVCEMKRLYVKPDRRGHGIGKQLSEEIVHRAKRMGYEKMVLDTLKSMSQARTLYRQMGFIETSAYYNNPLKDVIYMELNLRKVM